MNVLGKALAVKEVVDEIVVFVVFVHFGDLDYYFAWTDRRIPLA